MGVYTQCVPEKTNKSKVKSDLKESNSPNVNNTGGNTDTRVFSIQAFSSTTHQLTKMRCAQCHGSFQQPLHSVSDPTSAHNAIVDNNKVDFNNISNSRMAQKLRDSNHNCWSDCQANAASMEDSIQDWKDERDRLIAAAGIGSTAGGSGNNEPTFPNQTEESRELAIELDPNNAADDGNISLGAGSAILGNPMVTAIDGGVQYFWTPDQGGILYQNNDGNAGTGYLNFPVKSSNQYRMFAKVDAPSGSDNSFHVRVTQNNFPVTNFFEWHIDQTSSFEWRQLSHTSNMSNVAFFLAGNNTYTLEVKTREDGTKISDVVLTSDPDFDPESFSTSVKATLSYNLAGLLNVENVIFKIDVEEYDMYSYKFSNPRIETSTANVRVKNLKLIINDSFNPQHATYTLIDKMVTPVNGQLSTAAMVALKDQGPEFDRISFSFEVLQIE